MGTGGKVIVTIIVVLFTLFMIGVIRSKSTYKRGINDWGIFWT